MRVGAPVRSTTRGLHPGLREWGRGAAPVLASFALDWWTMASLIAQQLDGNDGRAVLFDDQRMIVADRLLERIGRVALPELRDLLLRMLQCEEPSFG